MRAALPIALLWFPVACRSGSATEDSTRKQAALMDSGLVALNTSGQQARAESLFRRVIAENGTHYGAHYQLAVALTRQQKNTDAAVEWRSMASAAEAIGDTATARTAHEQLALVDADGQARRMAEGLASLAKGDVSGAIDKFRAVSTENPSHYGAHYQLAAALERAGRHAEARPLWEKVLGMSVAYRDAQTEAIARRNLAGAH